MPAKKFNINSEIETVIEKIVAGDTYRTIAASYDISVSTLHEQIAKSEHSARVKDALLLSATSYADKAEEVLIQAEGTKEEIMRARELAQHYRWKASKRSPKEYGDKVEHTGNIDMNVTGMKIV